MLTGPVTPVAGVKLSVPFGLIVTVPWAGVVSTALATVSVSLSSSLSLPNTLILLIVVLIGVLAMSSNATGASLTSVVTSTLTVALTGVVPSVTVTATGGKSPPALTKVTPAAVKVTCPLIRLIAYTPPGLLVRL